jgi:hypothetical protein
METSFNQKVSLQYAFGLHLLYWFQFFDSPDQFYYKRTGIDLAEREGFEPSMHIAAHTRFPSVLLKPLGHLSILYIVNEYYDFM